MCIWHSRNIWPETNCICRAFADFCEFCVKEFATRFGRKGALLGAAALERTLETILSRAAPQSRSVYQLTHKHCPSLAALPNLEKRKYGDLHIKLSLKNIAYVRRVWQHRMPPNANARLLCNATTFTVAVTSLSLAVAKSRGKKIGHLWNRKARV